MSRPDEGSIAEAEKEYQGGEEGGYDEKVLLEKRGGEREGFFSAEVVDKELRELGLGNAEGEREELV